MIKRKCPRCGKVKLLTKHSKSSEHRPPWIYVCRFCHNKIHKMGDPKKKPNSKYQLGTSRRKRK